MACLFAPEALARLAHPLRGPGVADEIEEPAEEGQAVAPPKAKPSRVRRKGLGEGSRRIVDGPDRIGHDLGDRFRALVVSQEVIGDACWPRYEEATQPDPLTIFHLPLMKTDVGTSRLPSHRKRELVSICRQVANPVQGGG